MIIFDWDDTLLCTTFLGSLGFIDLDQQILDQLKPLDDSAVRPKNLKIIFFRANYLLLQLRMENCILSLMLQVVGLNIVANCNLKQ